MPSVSSWIQEEETLSIRSNKEEEVEEDQQVEAVGAAAPAAGATVAVGAPALEEKEDEEEEEDEEDAAVLKVVFVKAHTQPILPIDRRDRYRPSYEVPERILK